MTHGMTRTPQRREYHDLGRTSGEFASSCGQNPATRQCVRQVSWEASFGPHLLHLAGWNVEITEVPNQMERLERLLATWSVFAKPVSYIYSFIIIPAKGKDIRNVAPRQTCQEEASRREPSGCPARSRQRYRVLHLLQLR